MIFELKNKVSGANFNENKKILKCQPFLHRVYVTELAYMEKKCVFICIYTYLQICQSCMKKNRWKQFSALFSSPFVTSFVAVVFDAVTLLGKEKQKLN